MTKKKYILARNNKAKQALIEMGATLTPGKVTILVDDLYYNCGSITQSVFFVSGNEFDTMSPSQFGRFLRKNKLSIYHRD